MRSALEGRLAIRKAMEVPALLAPVHELTHHIHVINALAREAEYVHNFIVGKLKIFRHNGLHNIVYLG